MSKNSKDSRPKGGPLDDDLVGGSGNDILSGKRGNDRLIGLAGNDRLEGGTGNDLADGGSGSDRVKLGAGNDLAVYRYGENAGAHDAYDGGAGTDTLRLEFTAAEWAKAAVKADVARFLAALAHPKGLDGQNAATFKFAAFDLDVRHFEALRVFVDGREVDLNAPTNPPPNHAPVAIADGNGDDAVVEAGIGPGGAPAPGDPSATGNVLANDTDADAGDSKVVAAVNGVAGNVGAVVAGTYGTLTLAANGAWTYALDNADADANALARGATGREVFSYTMRDAAGAVSSSTLTIDVTGANDAPVLVNAIADQTATEDAPFSFVLAPDAFADIDLGDSVTLSAKLVTGAALPGWLTFDAVSRMFSGTPLDGDVGEIEVRVTATDGSGATAFDDFKLSIAGIDTAPTGFALCLVLERLPEDAVAQTRVKVADITYQDDAQGTETFVLTGPHAEFFEVDGTEIFVKAGAPLDFETNQGLLLGVDMFDTGRSSAPLASAFTALSVTDVRDAPSVAVPFTRTEFADGTTIAAPTTVAVISVRDDALGSHGVTLGGPDAALFTLIDNSFGPFGSYQLVLEAGVTLHATDAPLSVTFSVDDPGIGVSVDFERTFLVQAVEPEADEFGGILAGSSWPSDFITYSFDSIFDPALVLAAAPNLRELDEFQKEVARAAFQQWTDSAGLNFIEAPDGLGLVHVGVADLPTNLFGFAFFPPNEGTIVLDDDHATVDVLTWLHEIGHSLGLKHSFEEPAVNRTFDSTDFTVMSYTEGANQSQLGPFDIQAAQFLYGAADDAVWSWNIDTLTLTQTSGTGAQDLKGIEFADVMSAGAGNDTLFGFAGDDALRGDGGDDRLDGGAGSGDVAVYAGNRADYSLALDIEGRGIVTDLRAGAPDGTDTLQGIERLRFADGDFGFLRLFDPQGNEAPLASDDRAFGGAYLVDEDGILTVGAIDGVLANDADPDLDALTAVLVAGPLHGSVALALDGSFVYRPDADFAGMDSFTYRASDGLLESATEATVALQVNATDDPVVAAAYALALDEDGSVTLSADNNGATSADGGAVFVSGIALGPEHGRLEMDFEAGLFRYVPEANFNGVDSATVFLSDGLGDPTSQVVTFDVAPVNDAPVFGGEVLSSFIGDGIAENGGAAATPIDLGGGLWRLTPDSPDLAGAIWDEVDLAQNWTWTTEITLGGNGAAGGEGLAFVLQSSGEGALAILDAADPGYHAGDTLGAGSGAGAHGLQGAFGIRIDTKLPPLPPPLQNLDFNSVSFFQNDTLGVSQQPAGSAPSFTSALDTAFGPPLGLVISWNAASTTLSYVLSTPNGDIAGAQAFDPGALPAGPTFFGFAAATGSATNEQSVRVLSVVSEPVMISLATAENTAVSGTLAATDIDGDALVFLVPATGIGAPAHGSVVIDADTGAYSYTPQSGFVGNDSFTVAAMDGSGAADTVTINIGIEPVDSGLFVI